MTTINRPSIIVTMTPLLLVLLDASFDPKSTGYYNIMQCSVTIWHCCLLEPISPVPRPHPRKGGEGSGEFGPIAWFGWLWARTYA